MSGRFSKGEVSKWITRVLFVGFIVIIVAIALLADPDEQYKTGFDHYKTDIDIEVASDGKITLTEKYWFEWKNVSSGEMYLSKPASMRDSINVISVSIDGQPMTKASSYSDGRYQTDLYRGGPLGRWYYEGINSSTGDYEINAFYPRWSSGEYLIEFKYEVVGAVSKYTDCADLYYKVYSGFSEDLKNLTVKVTMPDGAEQEKTRIFGHGDPNGWCEFVGDTAEAVFKSTNLQAYTMFEIRMVNEQTTLFDMPTKTDKTFDSILAEEKKYYDDTQRAIFLGKVQIVILVLLSLMIFIFIIGKMLIERNKPTFSQPYMRDIPSLKPNVAASLYFYGGLRGRGLDNKVTATILNLTLQKIIAIEREGKKDLAFVSLDGNAKMTAFERSIHDMIFECSPSPDKKRVTLSQVKKAMSKPSEAAQKRSQRVLETDEKEFEKYGFVKEVPKSKTKKLRIVLCSTVLLLSAVNIALGIFTEMFEYAISTLIIGSFVSILAAFTKGGMRLTVEGENERAKMAALRKFYTDMTLMKERRAIELPVWEQHLVYATALGVSGKVVRELDVRLKQLNAADPHFDTLIYLGTFSQIGNISNSLSSISSVSLSSISSNSGGGGGSGGGFSGGGGGGFGGGGGGHR
ncbi:MAG: DUF2207 domain-containing protein [Methanomassiliicoccaceae archaeon]|nr:DUF2207 domain-containing protein [Methanomassiliicoccaceae archaeon]